MWIVLSIVFSIIIVYLIYRLSLTRDDRTFYRKIFKGIETYAIVVVNDRFNSVENVFRTLSRVLDISEDKAFTIMFRIHKEGIAIVWTGDLSTAGNYLAELRRSGLQCFLTEILPTQSEV
jgi:ATP-dependent Clp protease adapter protein ClpS